MASRKPRHVKPDDARLRCPGCDRELPEPRVDPVDPLGILAACANCRQVTTWSRCEGRWKVVARIMARAEHSN